MSVAWSSIPVLPLRCILDHLSLEDALAAMSTCRHWRSTVLYYQGYRDTLKLRTKQFEKNVFLTQMFKKHTRSLYIYIDSGEADLEKFMNILMPQFYDTAVLNEIVFIGSKYIRECEYSTAKLKRIILEGLIFKNLHSLQRLDLIGCEIDAVKNENDRYIHKNVEYYSSRLTFNEISSRTDSVISRCNILTMMFSSLQHITLDYEHASTECLETLSHLINFVSLSLNISYKRQVVLEPIDWSRLNNCYARPLNVSVNIIAMPQRKFDDLINNVFVEELSLVSLKVIFCKTFHFSLVNHVARLYGSTLREMVWADSPHDIPQRFVRPILREDELDACTVNPFILLCWKCEKLTRLAVHGYWIWNYDLIGCVRLRKSLESLEVSSVYNKVEQYCGVLNYMPEQVIRVLAGDMQRPVDRACVLAVNQYTDFDWKPIKWRELHPGLRARSTRQERSDYVVQEIRNVVGFPLC